MHTSRNPLPLLVLVLLVLSALACGSNANAEPSPEASDEDAGGEAVAVVDEEEPEAEPEPTDEPEPTAEPTDPPAGASRDNPAPVGTPMEAPNYTITLDGATRPATDIVMNANMFNKTPDEGFEYVMVEISVTCKIDECAFTLYNFNVIGSESVVYDPEIMVSGVDGMLESGKMLQGGTRSGKVFFIVREGETDLVLRWDPLLGDEIFFDIPETE